MPDPQPIYVTRPPKKISEMSDAELRRYAEQVWRAFTEANPRQVEDKERD